MQQAVQEDLQWEPRVDGAHAAPSGGSCASSPGMTVLHRRAGRLTPRSGCWRDGPAASTSCGWLTCQVPSGCRLTPSSRWKPHSTSWSRNFAPRRQGSCAAAGRTGSSSGARGSSSHATHRMVGSVAVSLARHSPVPLVIVL